MSSIVHIEVTGGKYFSEGTLGGGDTPVQKDNKDGTVTNTGGYVFSRTA